MSSKPAKIRVARYLLPALFAVFLGCQSRQILPREIRTPDDDLAKAQALAHYAVGFLLSAGAEATGTPSPPAAFDAFQQARRLDPASLAPAEAAVQLLFDDNRPRDAMDVIANYARHANHAAYGYAQLGKCAEILHDYPRAISAYTRALQTPGLPDALRIPILINLTRARFLSGDDTAAIRLLEKEAVDPKKRGAVHIIAGTWMREFSATNDFARTAKLARFTASLTTNRVTSLTAKRIEAQALCDAGQTRDAEKILLALLPPFDRAAAPVAVELGLMYGRTANTNAVLKLQKKLSGDSKPFHVIAAATAWNFWDDAPATLRLLRDAYPLDDLAALPDIPHFYFIYGNALLDANDLDAAARLSRHAIMRYPGAAELLNIFAYTMALQNKSLSEAETAILHALRNAPGNPPPAYLDTLGWIYYRQGRYTEALATLRLALRNDPDPVILEHLADTYAALGNSNAAIQLLQRALDLDPNNTALRDKLQRLQR